MNFCPKCGNSIGANDKFCPVCGEKLQNDQPGEVEVKPVSSNEPHQYQYQASGVDTREDKKKKDNGTISLVCGIFSSWINSFFLDSFCWNHWIGFICCFNRIRQQS